jgi:hypothetical protein
MGEKFHDASHGYGSEKTELDEYSATQNHFSDQYATQQSTPEAGPSAPPPYAPNPASTVPSGDPTNGVNVFTMFENIRGSWVLDPCAAQASNQSILQTLVEHRSRRREPRRFQNITMGATTAKFDSKRGNIYATLRVVEQSPVPATATIRSTAQSGNIVLELVSKSPSRTVHFDAYSRTGYISLLIPRSFSGVVELRGRRSDIELLPVLASSARVDRVSSGETIVFVGNVAPPPPGFTSSGDLARLYSRSGRLRLGFCGEDSFTESGSIIGQIFQRLVSGPA